MELTKKNIKFIRENIPEPYNIPGRFGEYILPKIQIHKTLCSSVKAEVKALMELLKKEYAHRFFCRVDDSEQQKSAVSIIDKIQRYPKQYNIANFADTMTDLARFRIVCNFLSDAQKVKEKIINSETINGQFDIEIKQTVHLRPPKRKSGERFIKLILTYKKEPRLHLEIQVMTQLEEAWDKKDHFLVYEQRRRTPNKDEDNFPDYLDAKMFAMSELLFIADTYFEELRSSRENNNG